MTISATLFRDQADEDRGHERLRVHLGAVRVDLSAEASALTVHDVSASGILLETDQKLVAGSRIIVEFPLSLRRQARVVWASNNFYGAQFTQALSPSELGIIYSASQVVWPNFSRDARSAPRDPRQGQDHSASADNPVGRDSLGASSEDRLSLSTRLKIIFGFTTFSWALIGAGAWVAFG